MIQSDSQFSNGLVSMLSGLLKGSPELVDKNSEFASRLASALADSDAESDLMESLRAWMPEMLEGDAADNPMLADTAAVTPEIYERLRELLAASRFRQPGEDGEIMPLTDAGQRYSAGSQELAAQAAGVAARSPGDVLAQAGRQMSSGDAQGRAPATDLPQAQTLRGNTLSDAVSAQLSQREQTEPRSFDSNQSRFSELLNAKSESGLKNETPPSLRAVSMDNAAANRELRLPDAMTSSMAASVTESQRPPATVADAPRLAVPAGQPQFANAVGEQIRLMVSRGVGKAVIRLDPPELGSLEIRMRTEGDHTKVQFIAQTPAAREALEQALPRLRELFSDQGQKIEASVSERDERANQQQAGNQGGGDGQAEAPPDPKYRLSDRDAEADAGAGDDGSRRSGLVDAYA